MSTQASIPYGEVIKSPYKTINMNGKCGTNYVIWKEENFFFHFIHQQGQYAFESIQGYILQTEYYLKSN